MKICGIQKNSFVDYPGKIAYVVFTGGCNFNCAYCHNRSLLGSPAVQYHPGTVLQEIERRADFLNGVVISGGEPTLQPDLLDFIRAIPLPVKLDTNGSHPDVLETLLPYLEAVAMDIKAPLDRYETVTQVAVDASAISKSIRLLMDSSLEYEFRTTMVPDLSASDIETIVRSIAGARQYTIQQYRPVTDYPLAPKGAHPPAVLQEAQRLATPYVERCLLKNI